MRYFDRREFLKGLLSLGAFVSLSFLLPSCLLKNQQESETATQVTPASSQVPPDSDPSVLAEEKTEIEKAESVAIKKQNPLVLLYSEEINEYRFGIYRLYRGTRFQTFMQFLQENYPEGDNYRILEAEPATDEDLLLLCSQEYIDFTKNYFKAANLGQTCTGNFSEFHSVENKTTISPGKVEEAARLIIGQAKMACDLVHEDKYEKVVSIGGGWHHAKPDYGEAYCVYNDVAFCAKYLMQKYSLERILILDTDAHAGNGTSDYFYDDPRVLLVDLHQDPETIYPNTGFADQIGSGEGKGFTINIPLPVGAGYDSFLLAFEEVVEPVVREFSPQIIIQNCGSDPYKGDRICELGLPLAGFTMIGEKVRKMSEVCNGKVINLINSGYNRKYLPYAWLALLTGLGGIEINPEQLDSFHEASGADFSIESETSVQNALIYARTVEMLGEVKMHHKAYWSSLRQGYSR